MVEALVIHMQVALAVPEVPTLAKQIMFRYTKAQVVVLLSLRLTADTRGVKKDDRKRLASCASLSLIE